MKRFVRALTKVPIYAFLTAVALFWLLPSLGLLAASLRTNADNASTGWWTVLTKPSQLTFQNYRALFGAGSAVPHSLVNTVLITVPATLLVLAAGALAAYAFAWMRFPGRDAVFLVVSLDMKRDEIIDRMVCNEARIDYRTYKRGSASCLVTPGGPWFTPADLSRIQQAHERLKSGLSRRVMVLPVKNVKAIQSSVS